MTDKFQLVGSWGTTPLTGSLLASGSTALQTPVNETVTVAEKHLDDYLLLTDAPASVGFGGVTTANVVNIFANRPITVRLTSAAGTQQVIPVDGWLLLGAKSSGYSAIDLIRSPAQDTTVRVFLAQKS